MISYLSVSAMRPIVTIFVLALFVLSGPTQGQTPKLYDSEQIEQLINDEKFELVDAFFNKHIREKTPNINGGNYIYLIILRMDFDDVVEVNPPLLAKLNKWVVGDPQSDAALLLRARYFDQYAWQARGTGWMKYIDDPARRLFKQRMMRARQDLESLLLRNPTNLHAKTMLLENYSVTGVRNSQIEKLFEEIVALDPYFYGAYSQRFDSLLPKWNSRSDWHDVFAFARGLVEAHSDNPWFQYYVALAHRNKAWSFATPSEYYQTDEVWDELSDAMLSVIQAYPQSTLWRSQFGKFANHAKKYQIAFEYFNQAAQMGDLDAMNRIAYYYAKGLGVAYDLQQSVYWYQKAIEGGHGFSYYALGLKYLNGTDGMAKNIAKGLQLIEQGAGQNDQSSLLFLGLRYLKGDDIFRKDAPKAIAYFETCAKYGSSGCADNLCAINVGIDGHPRNFSAALPWCRLGASGGHSSSMTNLAGIYEYHLRDDEKAFRWYSLAAQKGNKYAQSQRDKLISDGRVSYFSRSYFRSVLDRISAKIREVLRGV